METRANEYVANVDPRTLGSLVHPTITQVPRLAGAGTRVATQAVGDSLGGRQSGLPWWLIAAGAVGVGAIVLSQ